MDKEPGRNLSRNRQKAEHPAQSSWANKATSNTSNGPYASVTSSKHKPAIVHRTVDDPEMEAVGNPLKRLRSRGYRTRQHFQGKGRKFKCTESLMKTNVCSICRRDNPQEDLYAGNNEELLWVECVSCGKLAHYECANCKEEDYVCVHCMLISGDYIFLRHSLEHLHLQYLPIPYFSGEVPARISQGISNRPQSTSSRP